MRVLVTGGAGYIGRALCKRLREQGREHLVFDASTGHELGDAEMTTTVMRAYRPDWVVHLAATPGVAGDMSVALRDIQLTANVLQAMKASECKNIAFASTGSVYGEQSEFPTPEDAPMHTQTGFYATAKLASEGLIATHVGRNGGTGVLMRLGSILGPHNKKGFVADWVRKLQNNPHELMVWGNGYQRKSYMHVNDCASAIAALLNDKPGCREYNVAYSESATLRDCVPWVLDELGATPVVSYGTDARASFGDIPRIILDNDRLRSTGWHSTKTIEDAVRENVRTMIDEEWKPNE